VISEDTDFYGEKISKKSVSSEISGSASLAES
jgi:hypothetical protein